MMERRLILPKNEIFEVEKSRRSVQRKTIFFIVSNLSSSQPLRELAAFHLIESIGMKMFSEMGKLKTILHLRQLPPHCVQLLDARALRDLNTVLVPF